MLLDLGTQRADAAVELSSRCVHAFAVVARGERSHGLEGSKLLTAPFVQVVVMGVPGKGIETREGGREDHAGVVAQLVRQAPAFG